LRADLRRRYFPHIGIDRQSRAPSCKQFLPASDTKIRLRSNIGQRGNGDRKAVSELPNAFPLSHRDRRGVHLQRKDQTVWRRSRSKDDPTLRKGDIVAGSSGLVVAGRGATDAAPR